MKRRPLKRRRKLSKPRKLSQPTTEITKPVLDTEPLRALAAKRDSSSKLNEAQRLFCIKYIETLNAEDSYSYAYPNAKKTSSNTSGYRLLRQEHIRDYIEELLTEYRPNIEAELGEIMSEVKKMAFDKETSDNTRLQALKMLGQSKGAFSDKIEVVSRDIIVSLED